MSLETELKKLVEGLRPDLRPYMRFAITGRVAAVYEDEYAVDIEIEGDVSLPRVPVAALWAKDARAAAPWGLWALPEIGAEVTISFREGDVTRPYVENCLWTPGRAPEGFTVGMFVIRDRHGQRLMFKPDDGTLDLQIDNLRIVAAGNHGEVASRDRHSRVGGDWTINVGGRRTETIGSSARVEIAGDFEEIIAGVARREVAKFIHTVAGAVEESIGGSLKRRISGAAQTTLLGPRLDAIAKHWQALVGGNLEFTITNADAAAAAFAVKALAGNVSLETMAGVIQLGGIAAVAPAVLGPQLVQALSDLVSLFTGAIAIVQSPTPAGPVPTPLDPALSAQLQAWVAGLPTAPFLSQKVVVA